MISGHDQVDVFVGLDVGKSDHHGVALDRGGKVLFDRALPNDEARLRGILTDLSEHGKVLVVVDQPATIGALPVAVARDAGVMVGYLPGLSMRRIADGGVTAPAKASTRISPVCLPGSLRRPITRKATTRTSAMYPM